jgi:hypothetical protein
MSFIKNNYILFDFFNIEKPCPPVIKNCEELRKNYLLEIDKLKSASSCGKCNLNSLKGKYMSIIQTSLTES